MSTETMQEFQAPTFGNVDRTWRTQIQKVRMSGTSSLECDVIRPNSGPAKGGYIRVYKDEISPNKKPVYSQYFEGKNNIVGAKIQADGINFTQYKYVLCYAPHFTDMDKMVVSSVKILPGIGPVDFGLSACYGSNFDTVLNEVTAHYIFDSNPLGFGNFDAWLIVREGSILGEGTQVGSLKFDKQNDQNQGLKTVPTTQLRAGKTYNVSTTIYSTVRPVAGYTFTVPN